MTRTWGGVAAAVAICVLVGCGKGDGPALAPATGVVTLDGKPLENARVMFHPKEKAARYSYASTDASGRFQMSTFGMNDGALVGAHTVTISKVDMPEEATKIDVEALKKGGYTGGGMPGYESMMGLGSGGKARGGQAGGSQEVFGQELLANRCGGHGGRPKRVHLQLGEVATVRANGKVDALRTGLPSGSCGGEPDLMLRARIFRAVSQSDDRA